jgi:hypothetical protein
MHELSRAEKWLYQALTADAALAAVVAGRVYAYQAPEKPTFPFVLFSFQAGADKQGVGTSRVMTRPIYQVKAVGRDEVSDALQTAADRIDEVVGKAVRQAVDGFIFTARRVSPVAYAEPDKNSGRLFHHRGGLYRIEAYRAP